MYFVLYIELYILVLKSILKILLPKLSSFEFARDLCSVKLSWNKRRLFQVVCIKIDALYNEYEGRDFNACQNEMACFRVCRKLISLTLTRLSIFLVARNNAVKVELTLATIPDLSKLVTSAYVVVEIILADVHRRIYKRAMTGFTPQSRCGHQRKDVITRGFNLGRRLDQPWVYVN